MDGTPRERDPKALLVFSKHDDSEDEKGIHPPIGKSTEI